MRSAEICEKGFFSSNSHLPPGGIKKVTFIKFITEGDLDKENHEGFLSCLALVEMSDGTIKKVDTEKIRFLDKPQDPSLEIALLKNDITNVNILLQEIFDILNSPDFNISQEF